MSYFIRAAGCLFALLLIAIATSSTSYTQQGTTQIGKQAAELLMEQIDAKGKSRVKRVLMVPKLVIRQSTDRSPSQPAASALESVQQKARPVART